MYAAPMSVDRKRDSRRESTGSQTVIAAPHASPSMNLDQQDTTDRAHLERMQRALTRGRLETVTHEEMMAELDAELAKKESRK